MVWPRLSVSDYPEMLRKLSTAAFIVTVMCVWLLKSQVPQIQQFLGRFDFSASISIYSIPVPLSTLIIAIAVAVLSEAIKLHDKVSRLMTIRETFDIRWILIPMALLSGATIDRTRFDRIASDRRRLMNDVFYKYASSATGAQIDGHLITQALTAWSWFWVCVETVVFLLITAALLAWFGSWLPTALVLTGVLLLLLLMRAFKSEASNYSQAEISGILADETRKDAVKKTFNAL